MITLLRTTNEILHNSIYPPHFYEGRTMSTEQYLMELVKVRCRVCCKVLFLSDITPVDSHLCKRCEKTIRPGLIAMLATNKTVW